MVAESNQSPEWCWGPQHYLKCTGQETRRIFFSNRALSLLKLKGVEEQRGTWRAQGTECVADSEHLDESTGSSVVNKL